VRRCQMARQARRPGKQRPRGSQVGELLGEFGRVGPCRRSTTTSGSATTPPRTGRRHATSPPYPDKLKELQRLWLIEAVKFNVLPLDDRIIVPFNSDLAGRPVLVKGNSQILYGGMGRLSENSVINLKNKSHSVTAEIVVPRVEATA
jgi:hypothetical protein